MSTDVVFIEELRFPTDAEFAFVTSVHRAPTDEHACYALHVALDLFAPGQRIRLVFDSPHALDALYRALQSLIDDRDAAELPICVGCGALCVRVFNAHDDEEASSF